MLRGFPVNWVCVCLSARVRSSASARARASARAGAWRPQCLAAPAPSVQCTALLCSACLASPRLCAEMLMKNGKRMMCRHVTLRRIHTHYRKRPDHRYRRIAHRRAMRLRRFLWPWWDGTSFEGHAETGLSVRARCVGVQVIHPAVFVHFSTHSLIAVCGVFLFFGCFGCFGLFPKGFSPGKTLLSLVCVLLGIDACARGRGFGQYLQKRRAAPAFFFQQSR